MKIIILLNQFEPTDTNKHLLDDVLFLRQQNIDARILTLSHEVPGKTLYSESLFTKENFSCVSFGRKWDPREWKKLIARLSYEEPDLIIVGEEKIKILGIISARLSHVQNLFIFSYDQKMIQSSRSFFGGIFDYLANLFIVASDSVKEEILSQWLSSSHVAVIPAGIPFDDYGKPPALRIRSEFGFGENEFIFLFVGDLLPEKGADVLLRAFSKVPEGKLLIIGDGVEKRNLESLSESLGLKEKVLFMKTYSDVPGLLMQAGAIVFPSKKEEPPSVFVPALISGLPVIVSDFPGAEELIRNGENGLIVRKQDSEDLAEAMKTLLLNPKIFAEYQKDMKKELEKFSVSSHCAKILSFIKTTKKNTL
ncbi:MAG: glycosyltransferase family 4 protein [Candidatus Parcubacteria bacterium]|nr:glycosyltransferase family 4 protein [Candidatus Parcubacteria bacterium]